MHYKKKKAGF